MMSNWMEDQAKEWEKMEDKGWEFSEPSRGHKSIGIKMINGVLEAVFIVKGISNPKDIHTAILNLCKTFSDDMEAE